MNYMTVDIFESLMESIAPLKLAESYDNPGMLIRNEKKELKKVLMALDLSNAVAEEAIEIGADLVLTHHPIIFAAIKRLDYRNAGQKAIMKLIKHDILLYAAHTNWDAAKNGVNKTLCDILGLKNASPIFPIEKDIDDSLGMLRIAELENPMRLDDFACLVSKRLNCNGLRYTASPDKIIRKVAVCGGAGGGDDEMLFQSIAAGADAFVTAEVKHHIALEASEHGFAIIDAGHYESEKPAMQSLFDCLQAAQAGVQCNTEFVLSGRESAPLHGA